MEERGVKTALIGLGRWGNNVARELASAGSLAAIGSRDPESPAAKQATETYGVPVMTLEAICERTDIEAAWVTTPIPTHGEIARMLLAAGKHVMLEKPATGDAAEARQLAEVAAAQKLIFASGYVFLYHPVFRELQRRIEPAALRSIVCTWKKYGTFGEPIDLNLFTHHLSLALALLGEPESGTITISPSGNVLDAELTYQNATFTSRINRESEEKLHTIDLTTADGSTYRWDNQTLLLQEPGSESFTSIFDPTETALAQEVRAFITSVKNPLVTLPATGVFATHILEMLKKTQNQPVTI